MNTDDVATAFDLISEELEVVIRKNNKEGATAFTEGRYVDVNALREKALKLNDFKEKVGDLLDEWEECFDGETREEVVIEDLEIPSKNRKEKQTKRTSSRGSHLRVIFPDNHVIQEGVAAETFEKTLQRLGLENIEKLKLTKENLPLLARERKDGEYYFGRPPVEGRYINTHSSTMAKKKKLDAIAEELNVALNVEIIP
ncbi:MAG: hypothetical protein LBV54_08175 [Puniceicoccales bacterium]|jgi:hypothetical protein|nr:hypothetical protein [Puniceicoccales bacterium]